MADSNQEHKVTFDVEAVRMLNEMKRLFGVETIKKVLEKALALYEYCLKEKAAGNPVLVHKVREDKMEEILI